MERISASERTREKLKALMYVKAEWDRAELGSGAADHRRVLPTRSAPVRLDEAFEAGVAHLRFPLAHRRAIRTTNLLGRLFSEERRRTKVILHAFGERWRGIRITAFDQRQLKAIRDELDCAHAERTAPATGATVAASPTHLSSKNRT